MGIGPNPQSPIPNPQSPIPNPQIRLKNIKLLKIINEFIYIIKKYFINNY
jgi:hypothetical protein